jgi:nitrite reductase/ring-hydroxylating ferredoxin subunit
MVFLICCEDNRFNPYLCRIMKKLLFLFVILASVSCKKNKEVIPVGVVDEYINITLPQYIALQTPLNYIYYDMAGNRGLIIFRRNSSDFTILERTCTFDPSSGTAQVEVMSDNITCVDSTCGSKFSIMDGSTMNPPATQPLQQYPYTFDGTTLHIYN